MDLLNGAVTVGADAKGSENRSIQAAINLLTPCVMHSTLWSELVPSQQSHKWTK